MEEGPWPPTLCTSTVQFHHVLPPLVGINFRSLMITHKIPENVIFKNKSPYDIIVEFSEWYLKSWASQWLAE